MIYKKLYTKDSNGNTREWWIEQEKNSYRTMAGVLGGATVTSEWTTVDGKNIGKKNETSPAEQATKEIEAKYKKQLKTGYFEDINDIDKVQFIEPMLAKNYKDYGPKIFEDGAEWGVQCKFNGMRCIATKDGLFSRKGERILTCPHIEEELAPLFKEEPELVLDGELFNEELREKLNELMKLVRKTKHISQHDYDKAREMVKYYVYDGYNIYSSRGDIQRENEKYAYRRGNINMFITSFEPVYIKTTKTTMCYSEKEVYDIFSLLTAEGHEGVMLRNMDGPYKHGRSSDLLKLKPLDDAEFKLISVQEGTGNWAGKAKIITFEMDNGERFDGTFKGTMEEAEEFLGNHKKYLGKKVTVLYNGFTGLGVPNYARFDLKNQPHIK